MTEALQAKLADLERKLENQLQRQAQEQQKVDAEVQALKSLVEEYDKSNGSVQSILGQGSADPFVRRIEWTIDNFLSKCEKCERGESIWSPMFKAMGVAGIQLEFFPKGREATTNTGFCSLFLWCPTGTKIKYQLWVGSHLRAPDVDEYDGRMGHGHSNFCMLPTNMESVTLGVDIIDVEQRIEGKKGLTLITRSPEFMIQKEAEVIQNMAVSKVEWKIPNIRQRMQDFPRGASMYSKLFSAAGIREILLEFYPCGSQNTVKDGYCAFYIRCPEGVSIIVTLFVGGYRKGPIKTTFDSPSGKGLPEFCLIEDEIDKENDCITVGIEVQNNPNSTLTLTT